MNNTVTATRKIYFRNKGNIYTAIFMSDKGDLVQYYSGTGANIKFYPDFTQVGKQPTIRLDIMSATSLNPVVPISVDYYVNGTSDSEKLLFGSGNLCTAPSNCVGLFEKNGLNLKVVGNLANVAGGASFNIYAKAILPDSGDPLVASMPVSIGVKTDATTALMSIGAPDGNNFTIHQKGGSCKLQAIINIFDNSSVTDISWYKFGASGWSQVTSGITTATYSGDTLTVYEQDIETTGVYQAVVQIGNSELRDAQTVMDASDPYDVITLFKITHDGTTWTDTSDTVLTSDMDSTNTKLKAIPKLALRDGTEVLGTTVIWGQAQLLTASGIVIGTGYSLTGGGYEIPISAVSNSDGEYTLTFEGTIS